MTNTHEERARAEYAEKWRAGKIAATALGRRYVLCTTGASKVHAATSTTANYDGVVFPRPLCRTGSASTRLFESVVPDQSGAVTCQRCVAGLAKRGLL